MKITNEHVTRLLGTRLERVENAQSPLPSAAPDPDRAVFSSRSADVRLGLAAAKAAGQADDARLQQLADRVQSGRYHIPTDRLAEALLRDL